MATTDDTQRGHKSTPHTQLHPQCSLTDYALLSLAAQHFTLNELCNKCASVCKAWREVAYSDLRWTSLDLRQFLIVNDADISSLASHPSIHLVKELTHRSSNVSLKGFLELVDKCKNLTALHINYSSKFIDAKDMPDLLAKCPNLVTLSYLCEGSLPNLQPILPKLQHLMLGSNARVKDCLLGYPENQIITVKCEHGSIKELPSFIKQFQTLQTLQVVDGFTDAEAPFLTSHIRNLSIEFCYGITDKTLFTIANNCPNLEMFSIGGASNAYGGGKQQTATLTGTTDAGLLSLVKQKLKYLGLFGCNFSAEALEKITRIHGNTLEGITISCIACINDDVLLSIAKNTPKLIKLTTDHNVSVTLQGFERAVHLWENLEKVRAFENKFGDPLSQKLEWGKRIRKLNLYSARNLKAPGLGRIAEMCGKTLQAITLADSKFRDDALYALALHCTQLKKFELGNMVCSDAAIAKVIQNNCTTLEEVDIWYTDGGKQTSEALSKCKKLQRLSKNEHTTIVKEHHPFLYYVNNVKKY